MTVTELLTKHGIALKDTKPGQHKTVCPQCSAQRKKSRDPCLSVNIEGNRVMWHCCHCDWSGPPKGSGGKRSDDLTTYIYRDAEGVVRFRKVRNFPGRQPRFWLEQPDGKGGWKKGTKGSVGTTKNIDTSIVYRADEIAEAIKAGREICVVEGEKDADNLWRLDLPATCNAHGASELGKKPKWTAKHSAQLAGADLIVFNDNDGSGYAHADSASRLSFGVAKRVRRLDLKVDWPEIPKGGDVSDWLAVGGEHTPERLKALIAAAPDWEAAEDADATEAAAGEAASGEAPLDNDQELERLARMSVLDYAQARKGAAKRLGITAVSFLDTAVKAKRAELGLNAKDDGEQGKPINFATVEPWPEPVDGAQLLDELAATIRGHIVLADHARDVIALWVIHTYVFQHFLISVKLFFRAVVKGSGKTTSLDVLGRLVARPMKSANITSAALFRVIAKYQPTLLVDEVDTFAAESEELRGVLDASSRYDGHVTRVVGDNFEPRNFPVYTAIALAGLGQLHPTIMDRCIIVDLPKRLASEPIASLRIGQTGHLDILARRIVRFVADNGERIGATEPVMPPGMINRLADNWLALLAIADIAGGPWPQRARQAALAGQAMDVDEGSRVELLLGDVRDILDELGLERIASATLIGHLCEITPRPWAEYGRDGKPITQNKLARLLKPLGIAPVQIRVEGEKTRGYERHQFEEAFARYLASSGGLNRYTGTNADNTGTSGTSPTGTTEKPVPDEKREKSNNHGLCTGVPVQKGGNGPLGLSTHEIDALAERYDDDFYRRRDEPNVELNLDEELRQQLRKLGVLPEHLGTEFRRVKDAVFRVADAKTRDEWKDIPF